MPPLPKSTTAKSTGPGKRSSSPRSRAARAKDPGADEPSGSASASEDQADTGPRPLTPKLEQLRGKLITMYKVIGTLIRPLGGIVPPLALIGAGLHAASTEAADAWIELAREDRKVLNMLEEMTKASTWGNVIGIHAAILMSAVPGMSALTSFTATSPQAPDPQQGLDLSGLNLSPSDMEIISQMIQNGGSQMSQMPVMDTGNGGPGDTVRVPPPPAFQGAQAPAPTAAPPVAQSTAVPKAAIVSPEQLGVRVLGQEGASPFPASGAPNGAPSAIQ